MFHPCIRSSKVASHGIIIYQVTNCIQRSAGNNSGIYSDSLRSIIHVQIYLPEGHTYNGAKSRKVPIKADINAPLVARAIRISRAVAARSTETLASVVDSRNSDDFSST